MELCNSAADLPNITMAVHRTKVEALVKWINNLKLSEDIGNLAALGDGVVFVHIVSRLNGKENALQIIEDKSIEERFQFIFNFLESADDKESQQDHSRYNPAAGSAVGAVQKIVRGEDVELEMAKVAVLLLHLHTMAKQNPREFEDLDTETQGELVGILRFVLDNEEGIHMDNSLATFLQNRALSPVAHLHSASSDEVTPQMFFGAHRQRTQFLTSKVYSCSPSTSPASPMQDFMQTPQVQVRRMKRQLVTAQLLHNDLEIDLTEARKLITEKDTHISIMQQKVDRLVRQTERQASEEQPDELGRLQEKCESLLNRLRDAQKQSQDLKTEKSQTERKIDKLEEENGDLLYKVRDLGSRLSLSQKALNDLADEHDAAMPIWEEKRTQLQSDLHVALSDKKLMEEKIQILEGKISLMEDQLTEVGEGSSGVGGEVMGDVLQVEALKLEVSQLKAKASEFEQESTFHKEEKGQLTEVIGGLKQSICKLHEQKERQQLSAREQEGKLSGQLEALSVEMAKVNSSLLQKELQLEEEKQQRLQLSEESCSQQQEAQQAVQELRAKLESLDQALRAKEDALCGFERQLEAERESTLQQMTTLRQESERICHEKTSVVTQYETLKAEKESEMERLNKQVQVLEGTQLGIEHLEKERNHLMHKVATLDTEVAAVTSRNQSLQSACDAHTLSHSAEVAALRRRLQEAEPELERLQSQLAGLDGTQRSNEELRDKMAALQGRMDVLDSERRRWEETRATEGQARSQLAQQLEEAGTERERLAQQLEEAGTEQARLAQQLEAAGKERVRQAEELGATGTERARLAEELGAAGTEQARLAEDLGAAGMERARLAQQLEAAGTERARLAEELGAAGTERASLAQQLEAAGTEQACLAQQLEAAGTERARLADELGAAGTERARLEEELGAAGTERARLAEELGAAGTERVRQAEELGRQEAAIERAGQLQRELSEAQAALERSGEESVRLCGLEAAWKERLEAAQSKGAELERAVEEARDRGRRELAEERARSGELEARDRQREAEERGCTRLPHSELEQLRERAALETQARAQAADWRDKLEAAQRLWEEETAKSAAVRAQEGQELARAMAESEQLRHGGARRLAELQEAQEGRERLQAELTALQARLEEVKAAESQRQEAESKETERARCSRGELQERVSGLQDELAKALAAAAQGKAQEEAVREELQQVQDQGRAQEVELQQLQARAAAAEEELGARTAGRDSELSRHAGLLADSERQVQELGRQLAAGEEQHRVHGQEAAAAAEQLRSSRGLCQERAAEAETLQAQLGEVQGKCEGLAQRESEAGERCAALREQLSGLEREQEAAQRDWREERERLSAVQLELQSWQGKCAGEQRDSAGLREELAAAAESGRQLQEAMAQQREAAGRQLEVLRAENAAQQQSGESLQQQLAEAGRAELERSCQADGKLERLRAELAAAEGQWRDQADKARGRLETELAQARDAHTQQLQALTSRHTEEQEASRQREDEARRRAEEASGKYEKAKMKVLDDRHRFQEEHQQLLTQVADLNQKLAQHDVTSKTKLQKLVARDNEMQEKMEQQVMELNGQLKDKEEVVQHLKAQLEKAKTHYDSKKLLSLELADKLDAREKSVASLEQQLGAATLEGAELHAQSERLRSEAQQAVKEAKEANQKNTTLCAQVEHAERQLREVNKPEASFGARRSHSNTDQGSVPAADSEADFSKDSMELSDLDESAVAWNSTAARITKPDYKTPELQGSGPAAAQKLQGERDSLESLYFTPLPQHGRSNMDTSLGSLGSLSLDSAKTTRSGRKRTTQVINILMTKKQTVEYSDEPSTSRGSAPALFVQPSSSKTSMAGQQQPPLQLPPASRGRWRSRTPSAASLHAAQRSASQQSLDSNAEDLGAAALRNLPGFRPTTRRSSRLSSFGSGTGSSSTLYLGGCLDEPDQLDDWNRIAELQRRNGVCPPHLKTSYPLESSTAVAESAITEDELRLGDPSETLRRATLLPREISAMRVRAFPDAHDPNWKGVTTRQRKRMSQESHQGADTPEAKKQLSCFPRSASPKGKEKLGQVQFEGQARRLAHSKGRSLDDRRKSLSYTVLNTPRKLGSSLLRGINKRVTPRKTPKKTPKKSPRKSPRSNAKKDASRRKFPRGKM
ncbi:uncharacterized protein LOC144595024 isoform X2 [Rhinoraja longicauda]